MCFCALVLSFCALLLSWVQKVDLPDPGSPTNTMTSGRPLDARMVLMRASKSASVAALSGVAIGESISPSALLPWSGWRGGHIVAQSQGGGHQRRHTRIARRRGGAWQCGWPPKLWPAAPWSPHRAAGALPNTASITTQQQQHPPPHTKSLCARPPTPHTH